MCACVCVRVSVPAHLCLFLRGLLQPDAVFCFCLVYCERNCAQANKMCTRVKSLPCAYVCMCIYVSHISILYQHIYICHICIFIYTHIHIHVCLTYTNVYIYNIYIHMLCITYIYIYYIHSYI